MPEPYFYRNVKVIIHDEARESDNKVCAILSHAIAQATMCVVTQSGREAASKAVGVDYIKTWNALKSFPELDLPLWVECDLGANTTLGCLVAKAGSAKDPMFIIRRFTMKQDVVMSSLNPVIMGWSHSAIINAPRRLSIGGFVKVQNLRSDQQIHNDNIGDVTMRNALITASLMIGIMANMVHNEADVANLITLNNESLLASESPIIETTTSSGAGDGQMEFELT
jgi:hypothetical protein